ncbi:hypothetical protein, partial [Evtepia gabavorous]|uniref:hypothetical protein n=1 Tax=Evtepia gabavorous TaxID=2211183 RepID=UPI003AB5B71F
PQSFKLHGQLLLVRFGASCFLLTLFNLQGAHRFCGVSCILSQPRRFVKKFFSFFQTFSFPDLLSARVSRQL